MVWDWLTDKAQGASDMLTRPGMASSDGGGIASWLTERAGMVTNPGLVGTGGGGIADWLTERAGLASTGPLSNVDGAMDSARTGVDFLGHNFLGFGASLLEHGTKGPLKALGSSIGKVAGPAAVVSGMLGLYDDFDGEGPADPNSVAANATGVVGGGLSTASLFGAGGAGLLAKLGPIGAVIGAGAAGLTGGHEIAKFADSDHARFDNGESTYDRIGKSAHRLDEWISGNNYETGEQGHWARRALGTAAGVTVSGVGGIGAGVIGAGRGVWNWATS
jgi:hypothetical protein